MAQEFGASLRERLKNRQTMQQQVNNTTIVRNGQTPYRQGFPIKTNDFYKRFGEPIELTTNNNLTDNSGNPLIGFRFSKIIVPGLEPEVFASKALCDAGFTHENFAQALAEGDKNLQIVCHEGSNDIFIAPTKSSVVEDPAKKAAVLAIFAKNAESASTTETTEEPF